MTVELDDVGGILQIGAVRSSDEFVSTRWGLSAGTPDSDAPLPFSKAVDERTVLAAVEELFDKIGVIEAEDRSG